MPRAKVITLAPTAVDANALTTSETLVAARLSLLINGVSQVGYDRNGIGASQTPTGADAMTLDGAGGIDYNSVGGLIVNIYAAGADTARTFTGTQVVEGSALPTHLPTAGDQKSRQQLDQRALAGPIGPQHHQDLPGPGDQIHARQRAHSAGGFL